MKITRNKAGSSALNLMWPGRQLIAGKRRKAYLKRKQSTAKK